MRKKPKHISIIGRRWFQKTYGNTYHSVTVIVDGETVGHVPLAYGYGEQYIQSAFEILQKAGVYSQAADYSEFCTDRMKHRDRFTITVSDVARQKDL